MLDALIRWFTGGRRPKTVDELVAEYDADAASRPKKKPKLDPFFAALGEHLAALPADARPAWQALLKHWETADGAAPSKKWLEGSRTVVTAVGIEAVRTAALGWLPVADKESCDRSGDLLKGLVWSCSFLESADLDVRVGDLAERCFKKIAGEGAMSNKVGNACVWALGTSGTPHAIAQLSHLKTKVKYRQALRMIDKALGGAAQSRGVSRDELEELAVPDFDGLVESVGRWSPRLVYDGTAPELHWTRDDGKRSRSVPAELQRAHADELAAAKARLAQLKKLLPAQARRIETFWLAQRVLTVAAWRERYVGHDLVGLVSRPLVWTFGERAGLWLDGAVVDSAGATFAPDGSAEVRLWHPLGRETEVPVWRTLLANLELGQPFAQVEREVFTLKEDELRLGQTARFSGRVLRQQPFKEKCRQYGWRYLLQGAFDSHNSPTRELPELSLTAELDVDPAARTTYSAIYDEVTTGFLRFTRDGGQVRDVPPLVLSELMREASLIAG